MDTVKTYTTSVKFPVELLEWIDSYQRISAVNRNIRVTRSDVVVGFLETMKAVIENREKSEWGCTHHDEIILAMKVGEQRG